jgi:large subunit ribosomal protein L4
MVRLPVYNKSGQEVGGVDVDVDRIAPKISKQLLHDVVVMYEANARQGTKATRSRGMVAGSTKKMYRQKGTGNARAGSRRSPIRRGGGHAFALANRDFSYQIPRKAVQAATRMAVAGKIKDSQVVVIDELKFDKPQTKAMAAILKALKIDGRSTLVATAEHDPNVYKSARNIARVRVSPLADLNAHAVLKPQRLLITQAALKSFQEKALRARQPHEVAS